jgi:hypothetical protein
MRTAVLVLNYILVGILSINFLTISTQSESEAITSIVGLCILVPIVVVNLVYAHSNREK